jgi:membrane protease YdiL (CAAX protease family)
VEFGHRAIARAILRRYSALALLISIGVASLGLLIVVDRLVFLALTRIAPEFAWIAQARLTSLSVSLVIYAAIRPARPLAFPDRTTRWTRVAAIAAAWLAFWLACMTVVAFENGAWVAAVHGPAPIAGFLVFGLFGEELLYRGSVFELAERAVPGVKAAPVIISALLFGVQHMGFHQYRPSPAALAHVGLAFLFGVVLATVRQQSKSLWPGTGLHFLTNLPQVFGA